MKQVKLNFNITGLDGEVIKDQNDKILKANELTANYVAGSKDTKDAIRKLNIAQAMYLDGDMELEDADYDIVVKAVKESQANALIVGQILKGMGDKGE